MTSADFWHPIPALLDAGNTRQNVKPPRVIAQPSHLYLPHLRSQLPRKHRALKILASLPTVAASYAVPVRRASTLPSASFRSQFTMDTLAIRLTVPLTGSVRDFHPQVIQATTTMNQIAPVTALRTMPGAPKKKGLSGFRNDNLPYFQWVKKLNYCWRLLLWITVFSQRSVGKGWMSVEKQWKTRMLFIGFPYDPCNGHSRFIHTEAVHISYCTEGCLCADYYGFLYIA